MQRLKMSLAAVAALLCFSSCVEKDHRNEEYVEETYVKIFKPQEFRVSSIGEGGVSLKAVPAEYDRNFELESRSFYSSLDSSLVFKGWRYKITNSNRELSEWCAIDFRITKIDVITLADFDASHPAGSSINDLMSVRYMYMHEIVSRKLMDFSYGQLMLADYFPYAEDQWFFDIGPAVAFDEVPLQFKAYEVIIETAFGNQFKFKYPSE